MHITTLTSCKLHLSVDFVKWVVLLLGSMWAAGELMEAHFLILCNFMYLPVKLTDQRSVTYRMWRHPFKRVRGILRKPLHGNYITEVHNYKSDHQGSLHIFTFDQDIVFATLHVDYINTDIYFVWMAVCNLLYWRIRWNHWKALQLHLKTLISTKCSKLTTTGMLHAEINIIYLPAYWEKNIPLWCVYKLLVNVVAAKCQSFPPLELQLFSSAYPGLGCRAVAKASKSVLPSSQLSPPSYQG